MDKQSDWLDLFRHGPLRYLLTEGRSISLMKALFVLLIASLLAPLARRGLSRLAGTRWSQQQVVLSHRASTYLIWGLSLSSAMRELGFELSVLLSAAGIFSAGLAFSSQTSLSQVISGLFLIAEQPFVIGDTITVGGVTGEVLAVDLLSVKLRTPDNLYVRVPNGSILQSTVTNVSHFPIRRLDVTLGVAYDEDINKVSQVLFEVAKRNPLGLEDPKPVFTFAGFGDSTINVLFCVWARRERFGDLKNSLQAGIKEAFAANNIDIPFPQRSLVVGSGRQAFPIEVQTSQAVRDNAPSAPSTGA